jgi:NADPH:quinone reductase-like Zn-dependent oxidoreductase
MTREPTMTALVVDRPNGPLMPTERLRPVPGAGQVLVRIGASAVNPLDLKIRAGEAAHARHPFPAVLGLDFAGTVVGSGPGVTAFAPGDAVYGMVGGVGGHQGTLAEYAAVDADLLAPKPVGLSPREAAALPLIAITAWEGLVDRARVGLGQTVLVQGGAGGVGHIAVQIARAAGATVFATASAADRDRIAGLGATAIDHRAETVEDYVDRLTGGRGFDIVYDTVGGPVLDASFRAVRRNGQVVSCLGWGSHALAPLSFRAASYSGVFTLLPLLTGEGRAEHGRILRAVAALADAGRLVPFLDPRRFAFDQAAGAHEAMKDAAGKIVIEMPAA